MVMHTIKADNFLCSYENKRYIFSVTALRALEHTMRVALFLDNVSLAVTAALSYLNTSSITAINPSLSHIITALWLASAHLTRNQELHFELMR